MIGTKYYLDSKRLHSQDNNAIETLVPGLEYCGPTSAINCISSLIDKYEITVGGWTPQPEDLLTLFFIDQSNWSEFGKIRKGVDFKAIPPNRIPQLYPFAVMSIYKNIACSFFWWSELGINTWDYIKANIKDTAFQLCTTSPGHYIAVHGYDEITNELIFKDSWISRYINRDGFNKRMTKAEFDSNLQPFFITYKEIV